MSRVFYDRDADLKHLDGKTVGIIGYGNQGRAQALNLRDSGVSVLVGGLEDTYLDMAREDGQEVSGIKETVQKSEIILMLIPDEVEPAVYAEHVRQNLREGTMLCFASGYNIHFQEIVPFEHVDVVLLAPRTLGLAVRETFTRGTGVPADVAVWRDHTGTAWPTLLALAKGIGCTRIGAFESSFREEVELDLFSKQALWPALFDCLLTGFEVRVERGYSPEAVALEFYASGEAADIFLEMATQGLFAQMRFHSLTSQYGVLSQYKGATGLGLRRRMEEVLAKIRDGSFAREWAQEAKAGYPTLKKLRQEAESHLLNATDQRIRKSLSWSLPKDG
ncbi:MAG TPA: ketol-acid reductoisomerase [Terriglobales bacterium]|jgi:ketol-acid reductoisomerase|nr:ketol-acid reductoisomerase [Terriglobia bacterium]HZU41439.1 ketol-acid reductoisomerase [Terriglobales bacterium]